MTKLGSKIAQKRKSLGLTQIEFAEKLSVSRQTVSRWEAGTVMPDIDKIGDIAEILGVSCDYLLRDDVERESSGPLPGVGRLLREAEGKTVRLSFFDGEGDPDLWNTPCRIVGFDGGWMTVEAQKPKTGRLVKLISLSSVLSMEIVREGE